MPKPIFIGKTKFGKILMASVHRVKYTKAGRARAKARRKERS